MKRIAATVLVALTLTGCNAFDSHSKWFGLDAGEVRGRDFTPAHSQYHSGSTTCSGSPSVCTTSPGYTTWEPDKWSLDLYAKNGDHGWTEVGEQAYNNCKNGQWYPDCGSNRA